MPAVAITEMHPFNTKLYYSEDGGDNWVELADITNLTLPNMTRGVGDRTRLKSTKMVKRKVRGWVDSGQCKPTIQFKGTVYATLLELFHKGANDYHETYKIEAPLLGAEVTPATWTFDGFISEFPLSDASVDADEVYECPVTIEIDSEVVFEEAA